MTAPDIFDRRLLRQRRLNALRKKVDGADFLLKAVSDDLADRLSMISRSFRTGIDLGGHTGHVAALLRQSGKVDTVYRGDLFDPDPALDPPDFVFDDALPPLRDASVGLIVSALSLQFVNDLPGALIQIRRALEPDGLFLATLPGAETLFELRDVLMRAELELSGGAAPRVGPFTDVRELGSLLQRAGFSLPVTDLDRITVRYNSLFDLMNDLKAMGAASVLQERSRTPLPKQVFFRAAELYARDHADPDGRIRATFALVSLSGWAPHESQQKPLKPGSAKTRLADALKAQGGDLKT
ncbi:methyltransferase domain-containing protein [uncultured Roseibium sp.]|uniref:methyltransferase domain-containing protein n=1 Tax=uncultured Roseibium sp. TaxID=1936171 RepID=UPI0032174EC0